MKKLISVYVEGSGDVRFVQEFVKLHYKIKLTINENLFDVKGKDKLIDFKPNFIETTDDDGVNIVIFDSDYPANGGGYTARLLELNQLKQQEGIEFEQFLFPNNQDDGDLETFLENVINPNNSNIFNCWSNYENCVSQLTNPHTQGSYTLPAKKSKIYTYLETLLPDSAEGKKRAKDPYRKYDNKDHWELHNIHNVYVEKLKLFLDNHFQ